MALIGGGGMFYVEKDGRVLKVKDEDALIIFMKAGYKWIEDEEKKVEEVKNDTSELKDYTVSELREMAAKQGIQGTSRMKKAELINALGGE